LTGGIICVQWEQEQDERCGRMIYVQRGSLLFSTTVQPFMMMMMMLMMMMMMIMMKTNTAKNIDEVFAIQLFVRLFPGIQHL